MGFSGNVTVVLGGGLGASLGRKGTVSDITLYNHKQGDCVLSFVEPSGYPDKIQPLVSALNLADQAVLRVSGFDKFLAETIVALDAAGIEKGYLIVKDGVDLEVLKKYLAGSIVEEYEPLEDKTVAIREKLAELKQDLTGEPVVQVDHCFPVRGVGTVALGVVKRGMLKKYSELKAYPQNIETMVKSVQVHDTDVPEAGVGVRVGLALKDVKPEDIPRGTVLSTGEVECAGEIACEAVLSKYAPRGLATGDAVLVNSALNYTPAKIVGGGVSPGGKAKLKLKLEKPVPLISDRILLLDPGQRIPRIYGFAVVI